MEEYKLIGISAGFEGRVIKFTTRLSIGRSDDNNLVIKQSGMSRHHAEIVVQIGKVIVKDLGSANGTNVNGEQIITREIKGGEKIRVGEAEFLFVAPTAAPVQVQPQSAPDDVDASEATAFIDMNAAVSSAPQAKKSAPSTEYVDMGKLFGGKPPEQKAPSTEYVDMRNIVTQQDKADLSQHEEKELPPELQQPDSGSTSFIDMSEMMQQVENARRASSPPPPPTAPPVAAKKNTDTRKSPYVLCFNIKGAERKFELPYGTVTLGKDKNCDVVIEDDGVSPQHARISFDGTSLLIDDMGTASGVYVNLEKVVTGRMVRPGDEILLGRFSIYCRRAVTGESQIIKVDASRPKKAGFFAWLLRLFGKGD